MPWTIWNRIFSRKSEAERKRDKYHELYEAINMECSNIDSSLDEANTIYQTYKRNAP